MLVLTTILSLSWGMAADASLLVSPQLTYYTPGFRVDETTILEPASAGVVGQFRTVGFGPWINWEISIQSINRRSVGVELVFAGHRSDGRLIEELPQLGWTVNYGASVQDFQVLLNASYPLVLGPVAFYPFAGGGLSIASLSISRDTTSVGSMLWFFALDGGARVTIRVAKSVAVGLTFRRHVPLVGAWDADQGFVLHPHSNPYEVGLGLCFFE